MSESQESSVDLARRVRIIQEAITYSRRFRNSWFIVHESGSQMSAATLATDLLMLQSLGIHVAAAIGEAESQLDSESVIVGLRREVNRGGLAGVELHWPEVRGSDAGFRDVGERWRSLGESASMIVLVRCDASESLRVAHQMATQCSAAKVIYLERDWDPSSLKHGGPGSRRPSPSDLRPLLKGLNLGAQAATIAAAIDVVESGVDEAHVVPTRDEDHPILVEIFTDEGIGTWLGP